MMSGRERAAAERDFAVWALTHARAKIAEGLLSARAFVDLQQGRRLPAYRCEALLAELAQALEAPRLPRLESRQSQWLLRSAPDQTVARRAVGLALSLRAGGPALTRPLVETWTQALGNSAVRLALSLPGVPLGGPEAIITSADVERRGGFALRLWLSADETLAPWLKLVDDPEPCMVARECALRAAAAVADALGEAA